MSRALCFFFLSVFPSLSHFPGCLKYPSATVREHAVVVLTYLLLSTDGRTPQHRLDVRHLTAELVGALSDQKPRVVNAVVEALAYVVLTVFVCFFFLSPIPSNFFRLPCTHALAHMYMHKHTCPLPHSLAHFHALSRLDKTYITLPPACWPINVPIPPRSCFRSWRIG
jgi:hypothetical protein